MKLLDRKVLVLVVTVVLISLLSAGARADSLTGWWKLDESSGTVAYDSSGSGNDGTVYGDTEWEDGVMLASLEFDAADDWVDISNPGDYSTEADFTWSAWVRLLDGQVITDGGVIIAKCPATGDYGNGAKCLYVAADGKLEFNVYGIGTLLTETRVNDGLWHHVALTVEFETSGSNDTAKLYIDGDPDGSRDNWNVNEYDESDALKIGFANNNFPQSPDQTYFYGRIDDVRIYDYVLNANEIGGLFEDSGLWRFVVACDSRDDSNPDKRDDDDPAYDGVNNGRLQEIADAIIAEKAEFVVFPGDLVTNGTTTELERWRYGDDFGNNLMKDVYDAGITVMPVRGNHESSSANWLTVFAQEIPDNGPDEATYGNDEVNLTYYMEHRNAIFIGMDVYKGVRNHNVNQDWLDDVLAGNTRQHVFVFTHEPAFKVWHADCLDDDDLNRNIFWETLEDEPGCRLYFCGHDHFYDHAWIDDSDAETEDVHQMLVGTAGAPLMDDGAYNGINGEWTPTRIKHEKQRGYVVVEIWGEVGTNVTAVWMHRTGDGTYEPGGDVFEYTIPCFPHCHPDYGEWVSVGKPDCWCYPRQCHGDADGLKQGSAAFGYMYVGTNDLNILISGWKILEPPKGPGLSGNMICADFDHRKQGSAAFGYMRVGTNDLSRLIAYWKVLEPPKGPGVDPDCLNCQHVLAELQIKKVKPLKIEQLIKWLEQLWLDPEAQKLIDEDIWLKFIDSLKEEL